MKCAKCKKEKDVGSNHEFYYGKQLSRDTVAVYSHAKTIREQYHIAGSQEAWICRECLAKGALVHGWIWQPLLLLILAPVGYLLNIAAPYADRGGTGMIYFCVGAPLLCAASCILFAGKKTGWNKQNLFAEVGDTVAIAAFRYELQADGYDQFFTRWHYKEKFHK
jgi:hypothetical protein